MTQMLSGQCLCSEIAFEIEDKFANFFFCSCSQCRQITGSAFAANLFAKIDGFHWTKGEASVKRFKLEGRDITKTFCPTCGSGVPKVSDNGKYVMVPAGSLNQEPTTPAPKRIFQAERPDWAKHYEGYEPHDGFPS